MFVCCLQIEAELDSGAELPWHPLVATYLVADYDSEDNFCAVIPYAGCTIDSLIHHPEWETSTTPQDRLDTAKLMITQNLMAYAIMQKSVSVTAAAGVCRANTFSSTLCSIQTAACPWHDIQELPGSLSPILKCYGTAAITKHAGIALLQGSGYIYRDVKPTNVCVDASLNRISVIDFGLTLKTNMEDFFVGFTHGYYTPETFSTDSQGRPTYYCSSEHRQQATNTTMDVFLTSFMGLEVAVGLEGLPWELRGYAYDLSKHEEQLALMKAHDTAAKSGFKELIARVSCPVAQDFFERTMCSDPAQRLTPQQALNHEWLVSCRKAVEQATEAALPALQAQNQQLIEMFSSQLPEVLVPKCHLLQQQEDEQSQEKEQECEETNSVSISRDSNIVDAPATPSVSQRHITCSVSSAGSSHNDCDDTAGDAACEKSSYEVSAAAGVRQSAAPKVQAVRKLLRKLLKGSVIKGIKATLKEVKQQARARVLSCTPGCFAVQTTGSQYLDGCW